MANRNYWMYATIVVIITILVLSGILGYDYYKTPKAEDYDFNGIKINQVVFDSMANQFESNESFRLCSMVNKTCVAFER